MDDLLTHARQERALLKRQLDAVEKVIATLAGAGTAKSMFRSDDLRAAGTPLVKSKPKAHNPASREYWTAERKAAMSKKLKAVAAKRKKAAPSKAQPAK